MNNQTQAHTNVLSSSQGRTANSPWLIWPARSRKNTFRATVLAVLVLIILWLFGNPILRSMSYFILVTPIILVLSLLILAMSNIAFSIFYARRHRLSTASASVSQRSKSNHSRRTMPGSASRHLFHYLRPAKFTRPVAWSKIERQRRQEQAAKYRTPIADTMPQLSEAIDTVIELIMRDYVTGWMRAITPEVVLQQRLEELLRIILIRLKTRVMDLDLTQLLVTRLVPKVTAHVNDFRKAEMALRGNSLERSLTESDELDIMVAGKFRSGRLHKALSTSISTKATEEAYLRNVVQAILPTLLPASEMHSEILRHLLRELLVCAVLRPIMDLLSDPDYWNQNVDLYIGKAIREQNMVKKLREALKQHTDHMDAGPNAVDSETAPSGSGADIYSFEDFLKMIKRCDSLLDVKRIRNTIMTQMRKKKAQIVGRDKDDIVNGNKVEDIIIYINRLDIAKRNAEKRIEKLGGPAYPKRHTRDYTPEIKNLPTLINLDVVLTNPSGLSYFMEFLDQRDNMNELQFWLLIDTLNIKVEGEHRADTDSANMDGHPEYKSSMGAPSSTLSKTQGQKAFESMTPASMNATAGLNLPSGMANSIRSSRKASIATIDITDTLRDDVRMIYETYFAESAPRPVVIDHSLIDIFRDFALSEGASSSNSVVGFDVESKNQEDAKAAIVRQKLLEAQKQVFNQMLQKDYPEFARSDLYFKFLTSYQNSIVEQEEEARGHKSLATPKPSNGAALFSVIGLGSPEKRREPSETSKRSSTGSFLDIFGLGRDKDKDREQLPHARLKHTETNLRSSMLLTNDSRSKSSSPISTRTIDSGDSSSQSSMQPHETKAKQILEVSSSAKSTSQPLVRSRSFSSLSAPEASFDNGGRVMPKSSYMNSSFEKGHTRDASLDFTDNEGLSKSTMGGEDVRLSDSLLLELQTNEEDDEGLIGDSQGGLPIPRMPSNRNGNGNVIDAAEAVEAILSSIMETQDTQQEDLANSKLKEKGADIAPMDPTDPSFSTARDNRVGSEALLEWGKSHKKSAKRRFKEKTLETGKTVRVSSRNTSESDQKSLGSIFESQKSQAKHNAGSDRQNTSDKLALSEEDQDYGERGTTRKDDDFMSDDDNDDDDDPNGPNSSSPLNNAVLAAPGDLLLSARIKRLEQDIENVRKQEAIVITLIQKAERQGRQNELRILKKSKSALRREILGMEYQKTQYEVQEEENMIMPGRSTITITSSTVGHEGSKEFALYVIEVHQMAQDGSFASGWVIARRYSEFFSLNQQLREKYPSIVRQYELPGKRGFLKLQKSFVEGRRIGLERYLQCLVQHIEICQSQELRAFLSQENVALPQFSAASSILSYSLFDSDSQSKDSSKSAASPPSTNQFFFEQLFNSATSPLTSPTIARDPSSVLTLSNAGSAILDASGRQSFDGLSNADQNEGFMKHIYQTVSDGIDDMFGGPPTVLGNITKQLGNQMVQFTMENDDVDEKAGSSNSIGTRRRHGSHGERDSVRLVQSEIIDRVAVVSQTTDPIQPLQRPLLQRVQSSRSRRLSSPDPHTQHQRLLLQRQQQEQRQIVQRQQQESQQQESQQQQQPQQQDVPQQQQQQQPQRQQQQTRQGVVEPEGVTTFTAPLCDLFIELFELKDKNNWLRRQAVVIILQQVLGGTIERKLRDTIKAYVEESMLTFYVLKLRDALWPSTPPTSPTELSGGYEVVGEDLRVSPTMPKSGKEGATDATKKTIRTPEQKASTKDQANRKLSAFLPELLGNMVGHQNARRGARRVFAAFQNRRLNQQLVYTTLDEVIEAMWPELALSSSSYSPITTSLGVQHGASAPATTGLSSNFANLSSNAAYSKISSMEANAATISDSGERSSSSRVTSRSGSRKYK